MFLRAVLMPFTGIFLLTLVLAAKANAQQTPTITTDQADYPPGSTVYITGSGFAPNDSVTLQVIHKDVNGDNDTSAAHQPWVVQADENGNVSSTWTVPPDQDELGATLLLTADGQSPGYHAEWTFTDGFLSTSTTVSSNSNPSTYGGQVTFTITVSGSQFFGNPPGTVVVRDGGTAISGSLNLSPVSGTGNSQATFSTSGLSAGTHNITAVYTATGNTYNNSTSNSFSQTVNKRALTITAPAIASKVYDGSTTSGTVTVGTLSGFLGNETVTATATGQYSNANAGIGKTATITYTLANGTNGGLASNYSLANGTGTGDITPKPLTAASTVTKAYDGTQNAGTVTVGAVTGYVSTQTLNITASASAYSSDNVGSYPVTISYSLSNGTNGGLASNYSMAPISGTGEISPKALTTNVTIASKVYDGTTNVTGTISLGTINGYVDGETLVITPSAGPLSSANAGNRNTTVTFSLADGSNGGLASNYSMASVSPTETITAQPLTANPTVTSKTYNASTAAGTVIVGTVTGYVGAQTLNVTAAASAYSSANVGSYPTTISYTLANGANGGLASNYSMANISSTGSITPANLTVAANNVNKVYGNTLTSGAGSTAFSVVGLQGGQTVGSVTINYNAVAPSGLSGAGAADPAGTYIGSVMPSDATGGSFNAGNYSITYNAANVIVTSITACSQGTIWSEPFTYSSGTTTGAGSPGGITTWSLSSSNALYSVNNNSLRYFAFNGSANGTWVTTAMNLSAFTNIAVNIGLSESSTLSGNDNVTCEYSTNGGGSWTTFTTNGSLTDDFTSATASTTVGTAASLILRVRITTSTGFVTYNVDNVSVTGTPVITVNDPTDQTVCNSAPTTAFTFTGNATTYLWTNNNTSIGLAANGVGNIPSFPATNNTSNPATATITVTPSNGTCSGAAQNFNIIVNPPLAIATQPTDKTVTYGAPSAVFSVTATGIPAPAYKWQVSTDNGLNFTDIPNATSASLSVLNPTVAISGYKYHVIVSNSCSTVTSKDVSLAVNKATPTISVTGYDVTYDGNAHTATGSATGVNGETLAGLDLSGTTRTAAGTTTDSWVFTDVTGNYNDASGTVNDAIAKANASINVTPYSVTYDAAAHTATGTATGVSGETLAGLSLSGTTRTAAGTTTDSWVFTDVTGNYNDASGTVNDAIAKANASINVTPYSVTYDAAAHTATGTVTGVSGETLAGLSLSGTTHTNAGTYSDSWTFTDLTGNYNNANGAVSDAIAKATATINVTPYSVTYDAAAHTATGTATGVSGETLAGLSLTGTTHTNAGTYNDSWTFTDVTGNYNNASSTVNDAIAKAIATINVTPYNVTYDAAAHTATGTATGVSGETLAGLNLTGTAHTNAGTYNDSWTFTDVTGNYNNASSTVNDAIGKAIANIIVTPYNVTYDAAAHTAGGSATGVKGESLSGLDLSGTTHTNAGTYNGDAWTFTDVTGNYNNASSTVNDAIAKAKLTATADNITRQYSDTIPYTITYAGFVKGEDKSVIDVLPMASSNATQASAPGSYTIVPSGGSDNNYALSYVNGTLTVTQEDARSTYTGATVVATSTSSSTTANVTLTATIQDITAVTGDPAYDAYAGDIRNAKVMFVDGTTFAPISGWLTPVLVNNADPKTGTVSFPWTAPLGPNNTVGIVIDGYYKRSVTTDNFIVDVYQPNGDFITGGGYLTLANSAGLKSGDAGSKTNYGFNVKYNKGGTNLQGNINIIIRRKEADNIIHVYQVKGNSMTSLGVGAVSNPSLATPAPATFNGKASITDITNPSSPVAIEGNATLQVDMTDRGDPGANDSVGITVWNKSGALWYSSNWNGIKTVKQLIGGGNLVVHSSTAVGSVTSSAAYAATLPVENTFSVNVMPNPGVRGVPFSLNVKGGSNEEVEIRVLNILGQQVYGTKGTANQTYKFGSEFRAGEYLIEIVQGKTVQVLKVLKQ
jgi:hypothetical protein